VKNRKKINEGIPLNPFCKARDPINNY